MRRVATVLLVGVLLVLGLVPAALALDRRDGDRITVAAGETVDDDLILTGVVVSIEGTVKGDVIAFAQVVNVAGTIEGNLVAMGQTVYVNGRVGGSVYAVAQGLQVKGQVEGSLVSFGQDTEIDRDAAVGGSWIGFGNGLRAKGSVGRGVLAFAQDLRLNNTVSGDVEAWAGRLTLGRNAAIEGAVTYHSEQEAVIESGAQAGAVKFVPRESRSSRAATAVPGVRQAVRFAGFLVVGLILLALLPGMRTRFPRAVVRHPWQSPLLGLAALVAVPAVAVLLMTTVVGAPLGLLALLLYPVAIYAGQVLLSWTVGRLVADRWRWLGGQHWALIFLAGTLVTTALTELPFIRFACSVVAVVYGLGGLLYALIRRGDEEVAA
ncbi:hypothetical protein [Symbiobacterium terraclitae]|uniref:hypothetical protein n=1 Tax=Symbiobacterium terraclitae TaxID=557451 RepID=UPI0035B51AAD